MAPHQRSPYSEPHIKRLCDWIAAHPRCSKSEIRAGLALEESDSTVYRWLKTAVDASLIRCEGNTSGAVYWPDEALRRERLRAHLQTDHQKRPRIGYHPEWLEEYTPNKTSYLRRVSLQRLMQRCPPGTAPLAKLNDHDVSVFMCDLSYASSRLEGNDYDYASTIQLAEHHIEKDGGSHRDKVMILNHRDAVRYVIDSLRDSTTPFGVTGHVLRGIHAILSHELLKDPRMCGNLRTAHVEVSQSSYIPPDIPDQIAAQFSRICAKAAKIKNPFEQAFFLQVHLPYLQPFEDCNKRTARVACNIPLLANGVTPISWMDVTNRPRDYSDAIIGIYEHNDPLLLDEVFVDCFLRSAERFSLLQRQKNPDPIATKYRQEVKAAIRTRVLDRVEDTPHSVMLDDLAEFADYIERELGALRQNEMLGIRYGLTTDIVRGWQADLDRAGRSRADESSADERADEGMVRERVRG